MTAPVDFSALSVEDIPEGVPNHKASSGERGEKPRMATGSKLFGRTGGADSRRASNEKPTRPPVPKLSPGMKQSISDLYQFIGATIRPFDEFTGDTIIEQADKCADSVYKLAQSNDAVRRVVIALTTTSVSGAVIMAHLPIILAIARHSKNEKVKMTAAGTMMALKFADAQQTSDLFGNGDQAESPEGGN